MSIIQIKQTVSNLGTSMEENPLTMWGVVIAILLAVLVFGGLLFDVLLEKRRERQKIKAVERLHKHLASLPSVKS